MKSKAEKGWLVLRVMTPTFDALQLKGSHMWEITPTANKKWNDNNRLESMTKKIARRSRQANVRPLYAFLSVASSQGQACTLASLALPASSVVLACRWGWRSPSLIRLPVTPVCDMLKFQTGGSIRGEQHTGANPARGSHPCYWRRTS